MREGGEVLYQIPYTLSLAGAHFQLHRKIFMRVYVDYVNLIALRVKITDNLEPTLPLISASRSSPHATAIPYENK